MNIRNKVKLSVLKNFNNGDHYEMVILKPIESHSYILHVRSMSRRGCTPMWVQRPDTDNMPSSLALCLSFLRQSH